MYLEEQGKSQDAKHIYMKYNVDMSPKEKVKIKVYLQGNGRNKKNYLVSLWCCNSHFALGFQQTASA